MCMSLTVNQGLTVVPASRPGVNWRKGSQLGGILSQELLRAAARALRQPSVSQLLGERSSGSTNEDKVFAVETRMCSFIFIVRCRATTAARTRGARRARDGERRAESASESDPRMLNLQLPGGWKLRFEYCREGDSPSVRFKTIVFS